MKLIRDEFRGGHRYWFYCPGCRGAHAYTVGCAAVKANWSFDPATLSFTPSLRCYTSDPETGRGDVTRCHLHVTNGRIEFCGDCPHDHNGKTVDLPEFPESYGLPEPYEVVA